ncbi:MAG: hypothetical protein JJT96_01310 [Opitutales bacterium]|nr:hypothetical protein [Opitutales bacterium]
MARGSPRALRLAPQAFRSRTQEEHNATLRAAEALLMEDLPIAPIYYYWRVYLIRPEVRNWYPKLTDNRPYKYLYLQAAGELKFVSLPHLVTLFAGRWRPASSPSRAFLFNWISRSSVAASPSRSGAELARLRVGSP